LRNAPQIPITAFAAPATHAWAPQAAETDSVLSQRMREHWAAEILTCRTVWEQDPAPATAMPYVVALHAYGADAQLVLDVIDATPTETGSDFDEALMAAWRAMFLTLGKGASPRSVGLAALGRDRFPQQEDLLRATEAHLTFIVDRVPDLAELEPAAKGGNTVGREALDVCRAEVLLAAGQVNAAARILERDKFDRPLYQLHASVVRGLTLLFGGDLTAAIRWATDRVEHGRAELDAGALVGHSYVLSLALTVAGRLPELEEHLASTLSLVNTPLIQRHFQKGNVVLAALHAGRQGYTEQTHALALQAQAVSRYAGPYPCMIPDFVPSLFLPDRSPGPSLGLLWSHAQDRLDRGYVLHALFVSLWASERQPEPTLAERLYPRLSKVDSDVLRLLADTMLALSYRDVDRLSGLSQELIDLGWALPGYTATLSGLRERRRQGNREQVAQQAQDLWDHMTGCGYELADVFRPLAADVDLSARELEVAQLLAEGLPPQAISDRLVVSVRTVENHISSAYRKTGLGNRDALTKAMNTWLAGPWAV